MKKDKSKWLNYKEVQKQVQHGDILLIKGAGSIMGVYIYQRDSSCVYDKDTTLHTWAMYCIIGLGAGTYEGRFLDFYYDDLARKYKFL